MPRRARIASPAGWLLLAIVGALAFLGASGQALAHNELVDSTPAAGVVLPEAPDTAVLQFANAVPLGSASVEFVDAAGVRTPVADLAHGAGGETEILASLPATPDGSATIRWRLVGPDGHAIQGRVVFSVGVGPTAAAGSSADQSSGPQGLPAPLRWSLRVVSYCALILLVGLLVGAAWLMPSSWALPRVRTAAVAAGAGVGILGLAQFAVLASDIGGAGLPAWSDLTAALETTVGRALLVRVLVAGCIVVVLRNDGILARLRWRVVGALTLVLFGCWAFAGHARSARWPVLGVPLDIAHHAAAAAWLGGLAVVGYIALGRRVVEDARAPVLRFARLAPVAVGTLIMTGIVQGVRLTGAPDFGSTHTRLIVAKILALALMLRVADINRKRVARRFAGSGAIPSRLVGNLRRAMFVELVIGMFIIMLTAALVVGQPANG